MVFAAVLGTAHAVPEDMLRKIIYVLLNPVAATLVRYPYSSSTEIVY